MPRCAALPSATGTIRCARRSQQVVHRCAPPAHTHHSSPAAIRQLRASDGDRTGLMRTLLLGAVASLLSAITALIVSSQGSASIHPLWLLIAQYLVGALLNPPHELPKAPLRLHALRSVVGVWAFAAYYAALSWPGASAIEVSMLLNAAPLLVTFQAVRDLRARAGAVLAFAGLALTLQPGTAGLNLNGSHLLAASAALAYAGSFLTLGQLALAGERARTTNGLYNLSAGMLTLILLAAIRPAWPASLWPVAAIGLIAAVRIHVITVAAHNPGDAALVSVLTNLAFFWLALADIYQGNIYGALKWTGLALVACGIGMTPLRRPR